MLTKFRDIFHNIRRAEIVQDLLHIRYQMQIDGYKYNSILCKYISTLHIGIKINEFCSEHLLDKSFNKMFCVFVEVSLELTREHGARTTNSSTPETRLHPPSKIIYF